LERAFPNLAATGYSIESPVADTYNCVAYAAGSEDRWWEPVPYGVPGFFWPADVPRTYELQSFIAVYTQLGYEPCESREWEPGYEKVAIYVDLLNRFTHVAKSVEGGRWASKLGD
jgi:hypothetical protein